MRALQLSEEKKLSIVEVEKPKVKENFVLVKICAAALNHREIWISKGLYPGMTLPSTLGADGAGIVTEIGEGVSKDWLDKEVIIYPAYDWGPNLDLPTKQFRVLGMPDDGTIAEYISVPVKNLVDKPVYLSWAEAAAIPIAGLTSWRALIKHGNISKGTKLLITGIGGGVAQAGLSIANALEAEIYVTSSQQSKIDMAIKLGAKGGVNYKDEDWYEQLKKMSHGIDIVLDSSPDANLDNYLKFLNIGGKVVTYGSTGSRKTTLNVSKFFLRHLQLIGTTMGSPQEFHDMIDFMNLYEIKPIIDSEFTFDQSIEAFNALIQGQQVGKIVITF